jgi:hypothetical protein
MEPKKKLKKHELTKKEFKSLYGVSREELISRINQAANQIHQNSIRGSANTIFCGLEMAKKLGELFDEEE